MVISFGKVEGGRAFNVIADQVRLLGTVRCLDLQQHDQLPAWIEETVQGICASGGGTAGELPLHCATCKTPAHDLARTLCGDCRPKTRCCRWSNSLGAEDFAELLRDVPGMMVRLGVAGRRGAPLHNGAFSLEEDALGVGIAVLTATVLAWIAKNTSDEPTPRGFGLEHRC